jgi:hemerythrin-like domain-containing protein
MDANSNKPAAEPRPTGERVDTWEMVVVHRSFRREFRLLPGAIRAVAAGDTGRAEYIGDFLEMVTAGLHHHHTGEDELLWPKLLGRVGSLNADLVQRMESQHERVATLLHRVDELLPRWRARAEAEVRDELANTLADASAVLDQHLEEEEKEILPLVSVYVTNAEWQALGERGKASIPKGAKGFIALGSILQDATPQERVRFLGLLPPPVRLIWKLVGSGIHRRATIRLYGA